MKFITIFDPQSEWDFLGRAKTASMMCIGFVVLVLLAIGVRGMNWGIDFAGGTEMQIKFSKDVSATDVRKILEDEGFAKNQVQDYGEGSTEKLVRVERLTSMQESDVARIKTALGAAFPEAASALVVEFNAAEGDRVSVTLPAPEGADELTKAKMLDEQQSKVTQAIAALDGVKLRQTKKVGSDEIDISDAVMRDQPYQGKVKYLVHFQGVTDKLEKAFRTRFGDIDIRRVDYVDAQVAEQLKTDGVVALALTLVGILLYVGFRFNAYFAPGAVFALFLDPIAAMCLFLFGFEFDLPSVAALLAIVGYAMNNTVVIYDRIRETMPNEKEVEVPEEELKKLINTAINETFSRTINTTLTTLFSSVALYFFTAGSVKTFAAVLTVGLVYGAISSTFVAPMVYLFFRRAFYTPPNPNADAGYSREQLEQGVV